MKVNRTLARKTHAHPIFPTPGHDHDRCASDAIAHAEAVCVARKERLTPIRRQVLAALLASHAPLGAYELLSRLESRLRRTFRAPTIYRALEFLEPLLIKMDSRLKRPRPDIANRRGSQMRPLLTPATLPTTHITNQSIKPTPQRFPHDSRPISINFKNQKSPKEKIAKEKDPDVKPPAGFTLPV